MDVFRLRLFALARYRHAPYLMTFVVLALWSVGLEAAEAGGDAGWNCFIGCWWPPLFTNCWVHPGESCQYIQP